MDDALHFWQRARDAAERARGWPDSEGKTFFTTIAQTYMKMALAAQKTAQAGYTATV